MSQRYWFRSTGLFASVAVCFASGTSAAQPAGQAIPKQSQATTRPAGESQPPSLVDLCRVFVTTQRIPKTPSAADVSTAAQCLVRVREGLRAVELLQLGVDRKRSLVRARVEIKRLNKWIGHEPTAVTVARRTQTEEGAQLSDVPSGLIGWAHAVALRQHTQDLFKDVARQEGLFSKFSGVLVPGFAVTDTDDAAAPAAAATSTATVATPSAKGSDASTSGVANIVWQSRHFGSQSLGWGGVDISAGGRLGMQPVLTLVAPAATTPAAVAPTVPTTTHQNAFVWSAGLQVHKPFAGIDAELGAYGSLGSALLTTVPKVLGAGDAAQLAFPVNGKSDANAWRWESGLTFDVFDNDLEQIHAEGGTLTPQFQALIAWRMDDRFSGTAFRGAARRLLFRLSLDAIRIFDKRQIGDASKTYTFSFVVEKERAFGGGVNRLPSAMRYLVRGNVDLLTAVAAAAGTGAAKAQASKVYAWTAMLPGTHELSLGDATRVSVALNGLTTSDKQSVKVTPAPTVEVTAGTPASFSVPICPGTTLELTLAKGTLQVASARNWEKCVVTGAELSVTPAPVGTSTK